VGKALGTAVGGIRGGWGKGGKDGVGRKVIEEGKETLASSCLVSWLIYHNGAPTWTDEAMRSGEKHH